MPRPADPNAREALIAAARAEFAERGLRGARIEDITAACGLSKGAFYLHFPSKESLFGELVDRFIEGIVANKERRHRGMTDFFAKRGPMNRRDIDLKTERYQELLEFETREDLAALEHMWAYRDLLGVLVTGCQGTAFEGTFWEIANREVARVRRMFEGFQARSACRTDIPSEVFGSLIVGTYLLLGVRMSRVKRRPDLLEWARSLHKLIHEGCSPAFDDSAPAQHASLQKSASHGRGK